MGGVNEENKTSGGTVTGTKTYYPAAGAMRVSPPVNGKDLFYILKDHLGSASILTDDSGAPVLDADIRYLPFGEARSSTTPMLTDKLFTGQRLMADLGIYHYGARFYSPRLGRFLSADTVVPSYTNPQSLNRYSYVTNNPLRYIDPTGNRQCEEYQGNCLSENQVTQVWNNRSEPAAGVSERRHNRLRAIQEEAELMSTLMYSGTITDVEALARILDFAAQIYGADRYGFHNDLGVVIGGLDGTHIINETDPNEPMGQYYVGYAAFDPETTAFRAEYNANNDNQVRHFLAGAAGANRYGVLGQIALLRRESGPGGSAEDRRLYARAFEFVTFLHGHVPLSSAGDWVLNNLAR